MGYLPSAFSTHYSDLYLVINCINSIQRQTYWQVVKTILPLLSPANLSTRGFQAFLKKISDCLDFGSKWKRLSPWFQNSLIFCYRIKIHQSIAFLEVNFRQFCGRFYKRIESTFLLKMWVQKKIWIHDLKVKFQLK